MKTRRILSVLIAALMILPMAIMGVGADTPATPAGTVLYEENYGNATYATYEDRLKKALEEDPDQVMTVLTSVFGKLYETMSEKCAKTEISSALTFYNDKQYSKLLDGYEDDLETMEDRIKEMEDKYYKQFTAMEKALSKLQSQTNSLASLLGTNTQQ